jgi:hypothetical protein
MVVLPRKRVETASFDTPEPAAVVTFARCECPRRAITANRAALKSKFEFRLLKGVKTVIGRKDNNSSFTHSCLHDAAGRLDNRKRKAKRAAISRRHTEDDRLRVEVVALPLALRALAAHSTEAERLALFIRLVPGGIVAACRGRSLRFRLEYDGVSDLAFSNLVLRVFLNR